MSEFAILVIVLAGLAFMLVMLVSLRDDDSGRW